MMGMMQTLAGKVNAMESATTDSTARGSREKAPSIERSKKDSKVRQEAAPHEAEQEEGGAASQQMEDTQGTEAMSASTKKGTQRTFSGQRRRRVTTDGGSQEGQEARGNGEPSHCKSLKGFLEL